MSFFWCNFFFSLTFHRVPPRERADKTESERRDNKTAQTSTVVIIIIIIIIIITL